MHFLPDFVSTRKAGAQDSRSRGVRFHLLRAAAAADFPEAVQGSCGRWRARRLVLGAIHAKLPDGAGVHQAGEQGSCAGTSGRTGGRRQV